MRYKWPLAFVLCCSVLFPTFAKSQTLTVEKIMRDPKWIGSSPSSPYFSYDNRSIYFDWNPESRTSDSAYRFDIGGKTPQKANYKEAALAMAINSGRYNHNFTQIVYAYRGDIYLLDLKANRTQRITQTEDTETSPAFIKGDEWIVYNRANNLFAWNVKTGETEQLSNFRSSNEPAAQVPTGNFRGGGNVNRGGGTVAVNRANPQ